ncbi:hypothetical protein [Parasphingorhabdus pacifica]
MSQPRSGRIVLVGLVLMTVPLVPLWVAGPAAAAFGWDPHAAEVGSGVLAALLFVGMAGIAWELIRRAQDADEQ